MQGVGILSNKELRADELLLCVVIGGEFGLWPLSHFNLQQNIISSIHQCYSWGNLRHQTQDSLLHRTEYHRDFEEQCNLINTRSWYSMHQMLATILPPITEPHCSRFEPQLTKPPLVQLGKNSPKKWNDRTARESFRSISLSGERQKCAPVDRVSWTKGHSSAAGSSPGFMTTSANWEVNFYCYFRK